MFRHGIVVINRAVHFLNNNQTPVMACDQSIYAIAKQFQRNWKTDYGEYQFVIIVRSLIFELAAGLKMARKQWLVQCINRR